MTTVIAVTPTEMGITKPSSGTRSWNSIRKGFDSYIRKNRTLETKLVYAAMWCSGETSDSRFAVEDNYT